MMDLISYAAPLVALVTLVTSVARGFLDDMRALGSCGAVRHLAGFVAVAALASAANVLWTYAKAVL